MPRKRQSENATGDGNGDAHERNGAPDTVSADVLIEQAEAVRQELRDANAHAGELINALKRHRRQSKTIRSALASLRELRDIGV